MTCDAVQNRLLALPDLRRVPDELRGHLDGCPACRAFLARAARLDGLLAAVPVPPPSDEAKAALLDRVAEAGPIIRHVPVVPRRDSTAVRLAALLARNGRWRYAAAVAAAVLVLVGGWLAFHGSGPRDGSRVAGVRHELLRKVVAGDVELAKARTPQRRMEIWTGLTADLGDEIDQVHKYVQDEDLMKALAGYFDKAAEKGLLAQAQLARDKAPATDWQKAFKAALQTVSQVETATAASLQTAPQGKKPHLLHIRDTARRVRAELTKLDPALAGAPPGKGA